MKYGLEPIVGDGAKIIILGSLPGEESLRKGEYYAHSQNQFWRILFWIMGEELPTNYAQKCDVLVRHHVALWDTIHYADREGSLDTNIKNVVPNDFEAFFIQHPNIELVVLNGDKAERVFNKHFKNIDIKTVKVPSSSPARANLSIDEKKLIWKEAIEQK